MIRLKQVFNDCLGLSGRLLVNRDLYGYIFTDNSGRIFGALAAGDALPASGQPTRRSLRRQLQLTKGVAVNLCMFLVNHRNDFSGVISRADVTRIQYAIQVARDIWGQQGLGIRKIFWRRIDPDEVGGFTNITDASEATDLTDAFSGPNDGTDVFWVQSIGDAGGWSKTDGSCDKDAKDQRTGAVIELSNSSRFTGILLAHEVGHYLGLAHDGSMSNMMGVDSNNDGIGELGSNSTGLTNSQGDKMKTHCSAHSPC